LAKKHLAILYDRDGCAWDVIRLHLRCHEMIDEGFQFGGVRKFPFLWFLGLGWRKVFGSNLHWHRRNQACDKYDEKENAKGFHRSCLSIRPGAFWCHAVLSA